MEQNPYEAPKENDAPERQPEVSRLEVGTVLALLAIGLAFSVSVVVAIVATLVRH